MASHIPAPAFIRINDAVQRYSLSRSTFNRALASGDLTRIKRGASVLLEREEVERWVRAGAEPCDAQAATPPSDA
jgi:excisionase family DNA binding protein